MKTLLKFAAAATLTSAIALAAITPSEARGGRNAAIGIGIGAGVLAGAAIASANNGYYYGNGYYSEPGYAYGPAYDGYAYEAAPVYVDPAPYYYNRPYRGSRGCGSNPGSMNGGQVC